MREESCGAIVFRKNGEVKYLLLHYEAGHWDFAKGNVEKDETEQETAAREIEEETGIKDVVFSPGFKETIKYFYKREGKNIFKIVIFFPMSN